MQQYNQNLKANEYQFTKLKVSIESDNLINLKNIDAIVSSSDVYLTNDGGISKAILKACGLELNRLCQEYLIQKNVQRLEIGDCAVTNSCQLQKNNIKYIFHAAGPIYDINNVKSCKKQLGMTINNILTRTQELNLKSIGIPAISTGYQEFPIQLCAEVFQEVLQKNNLQNDLHVRLIMIDSLIFKIFCDVFSKPVLCRQESEF
ncbi:hypothetical protein FGO68_gene13372 [Halteria grandinella]|uniref:Macro domain-containing protein n=1 Tax=Halteria grandinella TaxID=5974 RepID=A0A8J8NGP4_HALGN|nr:hypothetical protein FGO68_gene13372 [Halteria grandinella]